MGAEGYGVRGRSHRFGARGAGGERRTRCSKAKLNAYREWVLRIRARGRCRRACAGAGVLNPAILRRTSVNGSELIARQILLPTLSRLLPSGCSAIYYS
jgi:hypothetical protein